MGIEQGAGHGSRTGRRTIWHLLLLLLLLFLGCVSWSHCSVNNSVHDHGTHNWCFAITGCLHKSPAMRSMTIHHVAVTVMGDRIYVCFSFVEGSVMSNLQAHVMLSLSEKLFLTCHQSWQRDREEGLQVPNRFLDEAEILGLELNYTYRYPLQMRKALGWYVRKALFFFMASQNIPSQSCTHLLRILLVMV